MEGGEEGRKGGEEGRKGEREEGRGRRRKEEGKNKHIERREEKGKYIHMGTWLADTPPSWNDQLTYFSMMQATLEGSTYQTHTLGVSAAGGQVQGGVAVVG